jgi:filamentous hemagglutinin
MSLAGKPALPTPCAVAACGPTGPSKFVTGGTAGAAYSGNSLTVNQSSSSAILNWSSFDIGAGGSVAFKQPSSSSVALNRIFQASPSQIFGTLTANGQVYLINPNGFLFGSGSTVNVGGLLASSLPLALSDTDFSNGILSPLQNRNPVLAAKVGNTVFDSLAPNGRIDVLDMNGAPVLDANGNPIPVQVVVQPGAQLSAASQGRLLLAGQQVTNGGSLSAPDGQIILAAGTRVYLQASSDPSLRGLVVEVDADPKAKNTAWNQLTGNLSAPRGNITLVGLAVNQDGRISATTSVSANGSIRLEAASTAAFSSNATGVTVASSQGGTLTVGPQSQMDILPELASAATAVAADTQYQSSVTLLGEQVILQGGSIVAPNGVLTAIAAANPSPAAADPSLGVSGSGDVNARLRIDSGTRIDLSGSNATLPVTANLVSAQLRANEFADDPTQRNGALRGQTVYFDLRNAPSSSFANLSGEIAAIPHSVAERTEAGGKAVFQSENDIVFSPGASLNVSGGATTYIGAVMQTTDLVGANGQLYPIATANPLLNYAGVVNPTFTQTYNKWGVQDVIPTPGLGAYQPGYVQGSQAGSVQFAAPTLVLQGQLTGNAINGLYQRTPSTSVSGGQLIIGLPGGVGGAQATPPINYLSPAVRFSASPTPIVAADDTSLPVGLTLELPISYLTSSGFTNTHIYSNYDVALPAGLPLELPGGSTLAVATSARVEVLSSITDPGGTLSFQNVDIGVLASASAVRPGVYVGDDVTFDVRGLWTNDSPTLGGTALTQTWQNGGQITLGVAFPGALLSLGNNVDLRSSGGAWLNAKGAFSGGTGGKIAVTENAISGGLDVGSNLAVDGFGVDGAAGGSFALSAPRIEIGTGTGSGAWVTSQTVDDTVKAGDVFKVTSNLFTGFGFQSIGLSASGLVAPNATTTNVLTVDGGTALAATVDSLLLNPQTVIRPSASSLDGLATPGTLPAYQRHAAAVSLSAIAPAGGSNPSNEPLGMTNVGDVLIGKGASISTDPGGAITLTSLDSIEVDGALRAPGGNVTLQILSPGLYDSGFLPNQAIHLTSSGSIDVSGTVVPIPSTTGLTLGSISAGGSVALLAARGAVVTDAGSSISVAGTSAPLDVQQPNGSYRAAVPSSAAGEIAVQSGQSISLLGDMNAFGGTAGTLGTAAGGTLSVALTRSESWWAAPSGTTTAATFNQAPLEVQIVGPGVGLTQSPANSNLAILSSARLGASGIDALTLEAGDLVQFSGAPSLILGRSFSINSPAVGAYFGAAASVAAPYVQIGSTLFSVAAPPAAQGGTGTLSFSASEIDLVGTTAFQGTSNVRLTSSGDLLLRGAGGNNINALIGGVTVDGNLTLDAARIFPATATQFQINAVADPLQGIPGSLTIGQVGANPGIPLSAASSLSIVTDTFSNNGTLYAPFGTIAINATKGITLGDQSLTSVSGNGTIFPYGVTQFGKSQWIYYKVGETLQVIAAVPTRAVKLAAPAVSIAKGATIDLSGGGDLFASEWIPGTGGSTDALAPATAPASSNTSGLYAVIPYLIGQSAPHDPLFDLNSGLQPNQSIYLSGGGGLAAGYYPLLPARYALEPGAFLIRTLPQVQSVQGGLIENLADGTPVVAGFLSYGSTGLHQSPGYSGVAIYPGSYGSQLAEYDQSKASNYFAAAAASAGAPRPTLPADAGSLALTVINSLDLAGTVRTAAATGGLAAPISIVANDLIIGSASPSQPADAVNVSGDVISNWHAGSLTLGGTQSSDGTAINVLANSVTVEPGSTLTADQIVLVANNSIDVKSGAIVQTTSAVSGIAPATPPAQQSIILNNSSGGGTPGMLAISDINWLIPSNLSHGSYAGGATVAVESGATVTSRGALSVDGVGGVALNGTETGHGAEWNLGSESIAISPNGTPSTDTLTIGPALLTQLAAASAVRLASAGPIDLLAPVTFGVDSSGRPTLKSLTITAASLNNEVQPSGSAAGIKSEFGAQALSLQGSGNAAPGPTSGASNSILSLAAGQVNIGTNVLTVNGFGSTNVTATGVVVGQAAAVPAVVGQATGSPGVVGQEATGGLSVGGDLRIAAAAVMAGSGASTDLTATGALSVVSNGKTPPHGSTLGGELSLHGASIDIAGVVTAPAGHIQLTSSGDTTIDKGAVVSAPGVLVSIQNQSAGTPGGNISITAGGNLTVSPGASLDVSGAGTEAGGSLALTSGGAAQIGAALAGAGGTGVLGGSFSLNAGSLTTSLDVLAGVLNTGGFNGAVDARVRSGDLTLDAGSVIAANEVTLAADSGRIDIGGRISAASGALRGAVSIFGGNGVELLPGGALSADGTGATGRGGTIEIGAGHLIADQTGSLAAYNGGTISLDSGSSISAAGAAGGGTLLVRAPALLGTNDVAITTLSSTVTGVAQFLIEPVLPFNTTAFSSSSAPSSADFQQVQQVLTNYMTAASPVIGARLGLNGATPAVIEPGAEIIATGALTLPALDLAPTANGSNWRFGANSAPADLTIRAAGGITVSGTISDGFDQVVVRNTAQPSLLPSASSSIRLVAGADLSAANPLAANTQSSGDLTIAPGAVVRTGTGDLDVVAAGNILLGPGSGAYTAGTIAIAPGGTAQTPYFVPTVFAGVALPYGIQIPKSSTLISFPTGGGNLLVRAGEDITASLPADAGVPTWQVREGGGINNNAPVVPEWGVNLAAYDWSFGTLGGGDLVVAAGRDATTLTLAAAGSLLPQYRGGPQYVRSGGLSFSAGRDIGSAEVFLADGTGSVVAGGALTAVVPPTISANQPIGSAFYLQSSAIDVNARLGIAIDGVFNPTGLGQGSAVPKQLANSFLSYSADSALSLQSITGDIVAGVGDGGTAYTTLLGQSISGAGGIGVNALPASLSMQALSGNIEFGVGIGEGRATLYPSASGQLDLLAAQNIVNAALIMSDAVPGTYSTTETPTAQTPVSNAAFVGGIHIADPYPGLVTAGGSLEGLNLSIPKAATLVAGQDILNLTYFGQNLNTSDHTLITAGRDVVYDQTATGAFISVGGPGALDVLAGRNVTLGFSSGITTSGNLVNPNLASAQGASVTVLTGLGTKVDVTDFLSKIVAPSSSYQDELTKYVEALQGSSGLSFAQAETDFQLLPLNQQLPLIDPVFFNELLLSGRAANATPNVGFTQGYAAIDALFPGSRTASTNPVANAYTGDLTLSFSQIYTLSGGDITLFAPGGLINVGLANPPSLLSTRAPSTLGIVAEGLGNVDIYTKSDINVNASRIFTLGGGSILIWSDEGSIDAGKGAKTSVSAPPPTVLFNSNGTVSLSFAGAATGSGIRTIQTDPTVAAGNVDLIAPVGTVNAGDAGIGAAGNINIAARSVIGASNINFGGTATGVPAAVSSIGASLSGASSAASGASNAATSSVASNAAEKEAAAPLAQAELSWLDVFVTGLGEENCKPDDIECLKRQKTPTR